MAMLGCPPPVRMRYFLFSVFLACIVLVHGQSQEGFISLDCGIADGSGYQDPDTNIKFSPDTPYIDAGESKNVPSSTNSLQARYRTLRSFPNGTRNCYRLWPVQAGGKYLVRAGFWYGNCDRSGIVPVFDLHIGVNFWSTVDNLSLPNGRRIEEIITVAQADCLWVCLVNTGGGTPFISTLELRPLLDSMYVLADRTQSLVLHKDRRNYGANSFLRYPRDPYDRPWFRCVEGLETLNSTRELTAEVGDGFQVPTTVLSTAVTTGNFSSHINIEWGSLTPGDRVYVIMHFAEIEQLLRNETRRMDIYGGYENRLLYGNYSPPYLQADAREINATIGEGGLSYNLSIHPSASSTRPPIINAVESFLLRPTGGVSTDLRDVDAIQDIKRVYGVKRNWMGDPCAPREYVWDGVNCSYEASKPPRIIRLNLTSTGLSAWIPASIANLTALTTLDLSNNNLTGTIPDFLAELPSLRLLILTGNQLVGTIPWRLCEKVQNAVLSLSIEGYPDRCSQVTKKKKTFILVAIVAPLIFVVLLLVISILLWRIKRRRQFRASNVLRKKQQKEDFARDTTKENHFTFSEIINITKNFEMEIGKGGFGTVYLGYLNNGTPVAVKVLSQSSSQGIKEFQAEALLLTRVHHRNLVSLLGYCDDEHNLALVYEYMDQGTLQDQLSGKIDNINVLSWEQRVKIALQAAQGLDYLHNGCKPPILHRDVKSANILLNHDFVAKLADFGLSRAFNESDTHISTTIAGTPGYLDPKHYQTCRFNEKSDVYSFGVVLLEIITGQRPFPNRPEKTHIVQWVHSRLECGDIGSIVDTRLCGDYDTNSSWKVLEIAMGCTSMSSVQRLTMSNVVTQLKECLAPEVVCDVFNGFDMPNRNTGETFPLGISSGIVPSAR